MTSLTSFITTLEGKRCTAVPKQGANTAKPNANVESKTTTTSESLAQFTITAETSTAVAEEESSTSTISSSTSLRLTTSTTSDSTSTSTTQQVEATPIVPPAAVLATSSPEPPPSPSAPPATTTTSIPSSTEIDTTSQPPPPAPTSQTQTQAQAELQSAVTLSSQTDIIQIAPTIQAQPEDTPTKQQGTALPDATSSPALPDVTSSPALPDSTTPPPVLFTTIGTATASSDAPAAQASGSTSSTNGAVSAVPASANNAIQSTVAIAGGVIGGVLAMSMIAFFVWFWRRRQLKKRRSTLLTPLTIDGNPSFGPGDEKGAYVINRGSIGPTPRAERFKAALGYNMRKIHGSVSRIVARGSRGTSVNMNRGNSQFMESTPPRNRADSASSGTGYPTSTGADVSTRERLMDWWTGFKTDMSFNWRLRNTKTPNPTEPFTSMSSRSMNEKVPPTNPSSTTQQPDFLTLLGMDDRELDREAQRRRVQKNTGSASSSDRFLGGLNLDFGGGPNDPFADSNAIAHISAKPAPLAINPFSDTNAIPSIPSNPNTYVAEMRRSRGQSVSRVPSTVYRESGASVESFGIRRNKFRSDPFDLEPLRAQGSVSSTGGTVGSGGRMSGVAGDVRRPAGAHVRSESFTSKYSSGISLGDWSDPGPDVGPAAERGVRESPTKGWRERQDRRSGGSQGSVGKAM